MRLYSYGKINLFLDIEGKLQNGYHLVKTVMQSVDIYDEVILNPLKEDKIVIESSDSSIPTNEKNTCYKAASLIKKTYHINSGLHIYINKKIPQEAGLAGGSGNAAAVIKGLNIMWNLNLSEEEKSLIGVEIGADVPFCLIGGTCLGQGIGDKITKLKDFTWENILIVKPNFSMSTPFVYKNLSRDYYNSYKDNKILEYISATNYKGAATCLSNTLERLVEKYHPEIKDIKKVMIDKGAVSSIMTGSGSAVFGLFEDNFSLNKAYSIFSESYSHVFKTRTSKFGLKLIV